MRGAEDIRRLREGGFSDDEVSAWMSGEASKLRAGGFGDTEIQSYFGNPTPQTGPFQQTVRANLAELAAGQPDPEAPIRLNSVGEALDAGLGFSVTGLLAQQKVPDFGLSEDANLAERVAFQAGTLAGDLPFMAAGALLAGGPASPVTATGGAFALPAALRELLVERYESGEIDSFRRFWEVLSGVLVEEAKGFAVGSATGTAGVVARAAGAPSLATLGTELTTLVKVGAALEGVEAEPEQFAEAAILIGGAKAAVGLSGKLSRTYVETGKRPAEIVADAQRDPTIREDLLSVNQETPRAYRSGAERGERPARREIPAEPEGQPAAEASPEATVLERVSIGERAASKGWSLDQFYRNWVDRLHPLKQAVDLMREGKEVSIVDDAYRLARLEAGASGKANHFLEFSPFKFENFERVGRPLKAILDPVKAELDLVRAYLVSKRAIELDRRDIRTGVDLEAARQTVERNAERMEPIARELREYQDHVLNYLKDSGVLSSEAVRAMREANRDYIPFYRAFEEQQAARGRLSQRKLEAFNPIKRIRGSEREILDPMESLIKNTYMMISLAEKNQVGVKLVEMAEGSRRTDIPVRRAKVPVREIRIQEGDVQRWTRHFERGRGIELTREDLEIFQAVVDEQLSIFRPGSLRPGKNQIGVYRGGKREVWEVDPDLFESFEALDSTSAGLLARFMGLPARTLRAGAILSPEFIGRNPLRDNLSAFLFSDSGFKPFIDWSRGLFHLIRRDDIYQDWLRSGGPMASLVSLDRNYLQKNIRQLVQGGYLPSMTARNVLLLPIEMLRALSAGAEQATRIGEFARGRGAGTKSELLQAGLASREVSLDFGRMSARGQAVNQIVAFFNAQVQGVDKIRRAFQEHPVRTTARIAASITIPSVVLHLMNRDEPDWEEIPQWQKDLFWLIPQGKAGTEERIWWRIPKPFEPGIIFGSGAERIVDFILSKDKDAFRDFAETLIRGSSPSVIPTALVPLIENFANRSLFLDRPLIPGRLERRLPQYQYRTYTTEATKALGQLLAHVPLMSKAKLSSPIIIENHVRAWTGGLGVHILNLLDKGLREAGVVPDPPRPAYTLADVPFIKGFVVRFPTAGSESVNQFYERYSEHERVLNTIRGLANDGEVDAAARELEIAGPEALFLPRQIRETLGNMSKAIRLLSQNPNISADEKRQIIDDAYLVMIDLAKAGNRQLDTLEESARR